MNNKWMEETGDGMRLVLLSGGSGKRLWPLSNDARSKQFLKILEGPEGIMESMVQRVWRQLTKAGLSESAVIATSAGQVDMIRGQLGSHVPIVVEPERRDTFPAIALAVSYLYSVQHADLDETVVILPVDPYVEDRFFSQIGELERILQESSQVNLALIGVKPTYASSKYGYIVPTIDPAIDSLKGCPVKRFVEKPDEDTAALLINDEQALWNCGVFAFRMEYLVDHLLRLQLPVQYDQLLQRYSSLTKTSFDYAVVEKEEGIMVLPYEGYWKDLGTWNTLTEEMGTPIVGKGTISGDSINSHLINELDIPVAVLGLSDVVVAVSPDGVLVSDKQASPRLKEVLSFDLRPMFEEKSWGSYKILDMGKTDAGVEFLTKRISLVAGESFGYHVHFVRTETWTIISGEGYLQLDGEIQRFHAGQVVQLLPKVKHGLYAITPVELIEVQSGVYLSEEDCVEFGEAWESLKELMVE